MKSPRVYAVSTYMHHQFARYNRWAPRDKDKAELYVI